MRSLLFMLVLVAIVIPSSCESQRNKTNSLNSKTDKMRTFDIKKFEENKGKQGYTNEYHYILRDTSKVRELSSSTVSNNYEKRYQQEIRKEFSPFNYSYFYYDNGTLAREISSFNKSKILMKEYDKNGKITKEKDYNKEFKYSFEDIRKIVLEMKGIDIYDTRQAVALRHNNPNSIIKKYYQIHVIKTNLVEDEWFASPDYSFIIDDETGEEWNPEVSEGNQSNKSAVYKTYQGKEYTEEEWRKFEQQQFDQYAQKNNISIDKNNSDNKKYPPSKFLD